MSSEALSIPLPLHLPRFPSAPAGAPAGAPGHAATAFAATTSAAGAQEPKDTPVAPTPSTPGTQGTSTQPAQPGQPGTGQPGQPPGPGGIGDACGTQPLIMMGLFLLLMWMLVLRPESKRRKEQAQMMASLQVGDRVVTLGGMHGTVAALTDKTVTLRVDDVRMLFDRSAVGRIERDTPAAPADPKNGKG